MEGPAGFAVIGDVHACDETLAVLLDHLSGLDVPRFCVGDLVNGPGSSDRCVELLERHDVRSVRGNHDGWVLQGFTLGEDSDRLEDLAPATRDYLRALPSQVEFDVEGVRVSICHGLGDNTMNSISHLDYGYALEANPDLGPLMDGRRRLVVKGHRHRPAAWRIDQVALVDVGCLLEPELPCAAVVDVPGWRFQQLTVVDGTASDPGWLPLP